MRLCSECHGKIWPYTMVILIAGFAAFLTWLAFSASGATAMTVRWVSVGAFFGVGGLVLSYVLCCLRRHCRHNDHTHA